MSSKTKSVASILKELYPDSQLSGLDAWLPRKENQPGSYVGVDRRGVVCHNGPVAFRGEVWRVTRTFDLQGTTAFDSTWWWWLTAPTSAFKRGEVLTVVEGPDAMQESVVMRQDGTFHRIGWWERYCAEIAPE